MSNNRFLELLSRKLSGEATAEELREINELLAEDADSSARVKLLQQFWSDHDNASQATIDEAFERLKLRLDEPPVWKQKSESRPKKNLVLAITAAASVIIVATIFQVINIKEKGKGQSAVIEKTNTKGVKSRLTLSDGTKIWLNADSKLRYPATFNGGTREVYLDGEAYFDVSKNADQPFVIHLDKGTIRVLGTSFNVRAYDNEKRIETSVATGRVAFIPKRGKRPDKDTVYLTRDNKLKYLVTSEEATVEKVISKEDIAWISGKLIFKAMTLDEISMELERSFGKKFTFRSDSARHYRLTGSFQNNSLEEILFYLNKTTEFKYRIEEDEVIIGENDTEVP